MKVYFFSCQLPELNGLSWDARSEIVADAVWLIPLVIAIVFHEVAHGLAARAFGDRTAERLGRLSFNPIRHVDPVGTVEEQVEEPSPRPPAAGSSAPAPSRPGS